MMSCVNSVTVSPRSKNLKVGEWYYGARAEVDPANACIEIEWYSDRPEVAGVNKSSGYICAHSAGTARIYARAVDNSGAIVASDYMTVTVSSTVPVRSVILDREIVTLKEGTGFALTATVCPENATNQEVDWESSNTELATVCYGEVIARKPGHTCIIAEAADGSGAFAECDVYVTEDVLVTSIALMPSDTTLRVGYSIYPTVTVCPTNATRKSVIWSSANSNIASVNPNSGLVYAKVVGVTTIYATASDGSGVCGCCTVRVIPVYVQDITVCPGTLTLDIGESSCLESSIYPVNATNPAVSWTSDDCNIADVDSNGCVTAKAAGTTCICANATDGSGVRDCCEVTVRTPINGNIDVSTLTPVSGNRYLTQGEMENNALIIYDYLRNKVETPWSKNAICALLGNMQAESTINPGRWQSGVGPGYGLVQWDPASKWQNWAMANHYAEDSLFGQLCKILNEVAMDGVGVWDDNLHQWQNFRVNPEMSFRSFTTSNKSVGELSTVFLKCYERPLDQSDSVITYRQELCSNWLTYLNGVFGS